VDGASGRAKEQKTHISWALESLLAYIERGLTMEVRFKLPSQTAPGEQTAMSHAFETLSSVVPKLNFPKPEERPILSLPKSERLDG
jgi:hypothetical protein